jgi:cytochrome b6-f complex iron-sulfur subunit
MSEDKHQSADSSCKPCSECPGQEPVSLLDRRNFLKILLGTFAIGWGAMTTIPILQYLTPPPSDDAGQEVKSISLGKLDTLAKGQGKNFQFGKKPAIIVRDDAGELHAFSAICSHLGCTVQFTPDKPNIWCACHGGQYDAKTGKNIAGPPPKPLMPLKADVVKGEIIISREPAQKAATMKDAAPWA